MSTANDRPWEDVKDPSYFRSVLGNMVKLGFGPRSNGAGKVRFGRTGDGYAPNYQIEGPEGTKNVFNGMGHAEARHVEEEFAEDRLSEQFSYQQVQAMLARLIGR